MQTNFSPTLLADPHMQASEKVIRSCVHCGFCTATCPTYLLLGDELDSPRGRIYLIKDMLENNRPAPVEVVKHVDRCLSCLACMTTCPSGVHYMHLVDHARAYIEATYRRPLADRLMRAMLARVLPSRNLFRAALRAARLVKPFAPLAARVPGIGSRLAAMLALAPDRSARIPIVSSRWIPPSGQNGQRRRVALLTGCAQEVLAPGINRAATRLINRAGVEVVLAEGENCCGSLVHHMGLEERALAQARVNIDAWMREIDNGGLEAIIVTASGCGTTIKDYGFMLLDDPAYAEKATRISALATDVTEYLDKLDLPFADPTGLVVAYHSACSMQHGQKITIEPKRLLRRAGFVVRDIPEGHICCGSAGTYNILQPEIAGQLRARKVANIARVKPDIIATGNIGCITQIAQGTSIPIVHTAELLDWACGGPAPIDLRNSANMRIKPSQSPDRTTARPADLQQAKGGVQ
jgi:glycolate oxidase iron-sulfur subunit